MTTIDTADLYIPHTHRPRRVLRIAVRIVVLALLVAALVWVVNETHVARDALPAPSLPAAGELNALTLSDAPPASAPSAAPETAHIVENVPYLSQLDAYPTGCESVSAVMLLNYYGFDLDVDAFIDGYLPLGEEPFYTADGSWYGADPALAFPGDPRSEDGWGCYAPVIVRALGSITAGSAEPALLYGESLEALCTDYIDNGDPVLIWATMDMETPRESLTWRTLESNRDVTWIGPMHCLVLIGYDEAAYIFNDPIAGERVRYTREAVEIAYTALGEQAVALLR